MSLRKGRRIYYQPERHTPQQESSGKHSFKSKPSLHQQTNFTVHLSTALLRSHRLKDAIPSCHLLWRLFLSMVSAILGGGVCSVVLPPSASSCWGEESTCSSKPDPCFKEMKKFLPYMQVVKMIKESIILDDTRLHIGHGSMVSMLTMGTVQPSSLS